MSDSSSKELRMTLLVRHVLFLLFVGYAQALHSCMAAGAQTKTSTSYQIESWDTDRGLPQNSVTAIVQSRDGRLWFGTLNGLVRFDGLQFEVFDENNLPELGSSQIVSLFEDPAGNLWVGTKTAGVVLIDANGQIKSLGLGQGASDKRLAAACADSTGAVWLYLADGQLWRAEKDRFTPFVFGLDTPVSSRTIAAERNGPVWVGTDTRLAAIQPHSTAAGLEPVVEQETAVAKLDLLLASRAGGLWRLADGRVQFWRNRVLERDYGPYPWSRVPVAAACEDTQNRLVVGTLGAGVFWLGADGAFSRISTTQGLSQNVVLSVCIDREGNLWVGTDGGGLNRVRRRAFDQPASLSDLSVPTATSVAEDAQGCIWIGFNGGGVTRWCGNELQFFGYAQGLTNSHVWSVIVDRDQRVWAGTWGGGLFLLQSDRFIPAPGSELLSRAVLAVHQDRQGRIWAGTDNGLGCWKDGHWRLYTTRDGLSAAEVRAIADDTMGNLWIGTVGGGLNRFKDGAFEAFRRTEGLPSDDISSIYIDQANVLWIGTFGSGLGRLDQGHCTRYTTRDGLSANSIGPIVEDNSSNLWLCSSAGIMRIPKNQLNDFAAGRLKKIQCRTYAKPDGLPTRECIIGTQPGACRASDGRLWFTTVKGIATTVPDELMPNPYPPPVIIQDVLVDGHSQLVPGVFPKLPFAVVVPPGRERLEFRFTSLNLGAPDRALFRYRLEGHDKNWTEPAATRSAIYMRLPPGKYEFHVTACNEDGLWNETGTALAVIVRPPFWRTWWFIGTSTLVLLALVSGTVHYLSTQRLQRQLDTLRHKNALEQERARIARDLHDQLGASLTQVAFLGELIESDRDQPEEVSAHAKQISHTARETTRVLDEIVWAVNPANDTLDSLANYLCKYTQEYLAVTGVRCRIEMPSVIEPIPVPPDLRHNVFMAAKEAVTNIVRHSKASEAHFRLQITPLSFIIEIEDNGCGIPSLNEVVAKSRHGLSNMRHRIEDLGGTFSIRSKTSGGTIVCFTMPLHSRPETL